MSDTLRTEILTENSVEPPAKPERSARLRLAGMLATDVGIGVLLAVLLITTLLFSSGASRFVYVDF
jgi:hypothetical protein